jgi:hypothetical protein
LDTPKVCSGLGIHSDCVGGIFLIDIDERFAVETFTIVSYVLALRRGRKEVGLGAVVERNVERVVRNYW